MDFWAIFSTNITLAVLIILIYFAIFYFLISHYLKTKEEMLSEDNYLIFKSIRFKRVSDFVIGVMCFAMILYLLGALGWIIYSFAMYYINLIAIPTFIQ